METKLENIEEANASTEIVEEKPVAPLASPIDYNSIDWEKVNKERQDRLFEGILSFY